MKTVKEILEEKRLKDLEQKKKTNQKKFNSVLETESFIKSYENKTLKKSIHIKN